MNKRVSLLLAIVALTAAAPPSGSSSSSLTDGQTDNPVHDVSHTMAMVKTKGKPAREAQPRLAGVFVFPGAPGTFVSGGSGAFFSSVFRAFFTARSGAFFSGGSDTFFTAGSDTFVSGGSGSFFNAGSEACFSDALFSSGSVSFFTAGFGSAGQVGEAFLQCPSDTRVAVGTRGPVAVSTPPSFADSANTAAEHCSPWVSATLYGVAVAQMPQAPLPSPLTDKQKITTTDNNPAHDGVHTMTMIKTKGKPARARAATLSTSSTAQSSPLGSPASVEAWPHLTDGVILAGDAGGPGGSHRRLTAQWTMTSGGSFCALSTDGAGNPCVQDTSGNYGNDEECSFTLETDGATLFRTEWGVEAEPSCNYDYLQVNGGTKYCGATSATTAFPASMAVSGTTAFTFSSDYSTNGVGFKICAQPPPGVPWDGGEIGSWTELSTAIKQSVGTVVVTLAANFNCNYNSRIHNIEIGNGQDVTIHANGAVCNAQQAGHFFYVFFATLTLNGMTLKNGYTDSVVSVFTVHFCGWPFVTLLQPTPFCNAPFLQPPCAMLLQTLLQHHVENSTGTREGPS
jgi:hypothetical protein